MTLRRSTRAFRAPRLAGLVVLAAATVVAVSGCGTELRPGTAAIVNGTTISEGHIDDLVRAACDYSELQRVQGGGQKPTLLVGDLRSRFTDALISFQLADEASAKLGLEVDDSLVDSVASGNPMPTELDDHTADVISTFFQDAARAQLQQGAMGKHEQDPSYTVADKSLTQTDVDNGRKVLAKFAAQQDVKVNPEFGTWNGSAVVGGSGSLSDPVSTNAKAAAARSSASGVDDLPPSQVCG